MFWSACHIRHAILPASHRLLIYPLIIRDWNKCKLKQIFTWSKKNKNSFSASSPSECLVPWLFSHVSEKFALNTIQWITWILLSSHVVCFIRGGFIALHVDQDQFMSSHFKIVLMWPVTITTRSSSPRSTNSNRIFLQIWVSGHIPRKVNECV